MAPDGGAVAPIGRMGTLWATHAAFLAAEDVSSVALPNVDWDDILDFVLTAIVAALIARSWCKRPRTTKVVLAMWLLWLTWTFTLGEGLTVEERIAVAVGATKDALHALLTMFVAWFNLALPLFSDASKLLRPVLSAIGQGAKYIWQTTNWAQRVITLLVVLAACGVIKGLVVLYRRLRRIREHAAQIHSSVGDRMGEQRKAIREAALPILFQLSFVFVGPAAWYLVQKLPEDYAEDVTEFVMSAVPTFAGLRALLKLQAWRRERVKEMMAASNGSKKSWFKWFKMEEEVSAKGVPAELKDSLSKWLAYWACWPFFSVIDVVMHRCFADEDVPAIDGVVVALSLWAMVWRASRIAPYLLSVVATVFSKVIKRASDAVGTMSNRAMGVLWQARSSFTTKGGTAAMIAVGVFLLVALLLAVFKIASELLAFLVLWAVAVDSARVVAKQDADLCSARLAFWVVAMAWLWLSTLPVLSEILPMWTPILLVGALVAGETVLDWMLYLFLLILSRCLSIVASCCGVLAAPPAQQAGNSEPLLQVDDVEASRAAGQRSPLLEAPDPKSTSSSSEKLGKVVELPRTAKMALLATRMRQLAATKRLRPAVDLGPCSTSRLQPSCRNAGNVASRFAPSPLEP
eukprot:CAMPEP_0117569774 /NCGR_PEP_ID=MMETSP0784-20121206/58839_1 /TAXON_ID=39447 /ORGANISM="" /LENGTH=631 /DNA_ID=CAMNT_0005367773 /DNA_START=53 /DNA_END=1945 /DNA_ORIENTATION=-